MFLKLFSNRFFIGVLVLVVCCVGILYFLRTQTPKEPVVIYKPVEVEKPKETKPPVGDPSEGHVHADGTFHEGTHEADDPPAVSASKSYIPEGAAVTPDFPPVDPTQDPVEAAYKRLEYIKNNPYAWGGVHSERVTELIAQLMPPPVLVAHGDGEEVYVLIEELIVENDPRAAAVLITNICDGAIAGHSMFDGLVAIGPPAVSYILPYLREDNVWAGMCAQFLARIAIDYPSDLGGIVDHIIIPKIAEIAGDEHFESYGSGTVIDAKAALLMLGR